MRVEGYASRLGAFSARDLRGNMQKHSSPPYVILFLSLSLSVFPHLTYLGQWKHTHTHTHMNDDGSNLRQAGNYYPAKC